MKTIKFLTAAFLLVSSFSAMADDKIAGSTDAKRVATAPYIMTDGGEAVPTELALVKAKNALVPVPPYHFDNDSSEIQVIRSLVPAAPLVWGDADQSAPAGLSVKAKNAGVPIAPMPFADPILFPQDLAGLK